MAWDISETKFYSQGTQIKLEKGELNKGDLLIPDVNHRKDKLSLDPNPTEVLGHLIKIETKRLAHTFENYVLLEKIHVRNRARRESGGQYGPSELTKNRRLIDD